MENNYSLAVSVVGLVFASISLFVCGWLGFIGALLGIIGLAISHGKTSSAVCGIIGLTIGTISGFLWLIILCAF